MSPTERFKSTSFREVHVLYRAKGFGFLDVNNENLIMVRKFIFEINKSNKVVTELII